MKQQRQQLTGGWFPIETAPKDGTRILAWPCVVGYEDVGSGIFRHAQDVMGVACVSWVGIYSAWWVSPNEATEDDPEDQHPTHWQPLPEGPTA